MKLPLAAVAAVVVASPVPASVQRAIPNKVARELRYVPTEVPPGYRYAKWHGERKALQIYFARKGHRATLVFQAAASGPAGTCTGGGPRTYRFGSVVVSSETDRYTEQYWRCLGGGRDGIAAVTRRSDGLTAARRRAIAEMVAFAKRLD